MVLHEGNAAKEVAQQREQRAPRDAAQHVKDYEVAPVHTAHACDKRYERADEREESAEEDGQVAPLLEKLLALLDALGRHDLDLARLDDLAAEEVANHEVALVAQDGRTPRRGQQRHDVEATALSEEARGKQQRVAGQEREEHHAGLDEDDEEDASIGHERAGGNPAGDSHARVVQQLDDEVDEAHVPSVPAALGHDWFPVCPARCGSASASRPSLAGAVRIVGARYPRSATADGIRTPLSTGKGSATQQNVPRPRAADKGRRVSKPSALGGNGCPSEAPYGCCLPALTRFEV